MRIHIYNWLLGRKYVTYVLWMTKNPFGKISNLVRRISIGGKEIGGEYGGKWIRSVYSVSEMYVYVKTMSAPWNLRETRYEGIAKMERVAPGETSNKPGPFLTRERWIVHFLGHATSEIQSPLSNVDLINGITHALNVVGKSSRFAGLHCAEREIVISAN